MAIDHDTTYRENLRKKLGLGDKKISEEDTPIVPTEVPGETPEVDPTAVAPTETQGSGLNPEADALLNEVLQFVNELEEKHSPRMVKSLWVYLEDNKDKIAKVIVGKTEKAEKVI